LQHRPNSQQWRVGLFLCVRAVYWGGLTLTNAKW
jgi:hypothetical protein